jgi:thioredoxin-like negative regulator of GroEL
VFCTVNTQQCRDISAAFKVSSIPQFNFFLNGKENEKFVGANEDKFRKALSTLHKELSNKAGEHMQLEFKQYKPMNLMPVCFTNQG